jgi:hypothetical protein
MRRAPGYILFFLTALELLISLSFSAAQQAAQSTNTFGLDFPPAGVLSKPFLEFRARGPSITPPSLGGHAFVAFGRELPDGSTIYYTVVGFYPNHNTFRNMISGPGHVDYMLPDISSDISFKVRITADQEKAAKFVVKNWNDNEFAILSQNCVNFIKAIAKVTGLDVGGVNTMMTPYQQVQLLKNENDPDRPLRYAITEGRRIEAVRRGDAQAIQGINNYIEQHAAEVRQSQDAWDRWQAGPGQTFGSSVGAGGGIGLSPFPANSIMSLTWPWKPPTGASQ